MALINCTECDKLISEKAVSCPNCGCPLDNNESVPIKGKETFLNEMLSVKDIQEHLGISQGKVYALIRSKGFPKITIGHRYFIPKDKYIKWIDENVKHKIIL